LEKILLIEVIKIPFKSKAQRRKFYMLYKQGKISKKTLDEWGSATKGKKLPNRVKKKRKKK